VDNSLREFGTDHLDLLLIHRPDALMNPQDLGQTFEHLHRQGKVRSFGVSNHSVSHFTLLHRHHPLVTNQIECSVLQMKALGDGTLDQCLDLGICPMVWSPLGGGRLFTAQDKQATRVRSVLRKLAADYSAAPATLALAWLLRHPSRPVPVTGSQREQPLDQAMAALRIQLSAEHWYELWQASMGHAVP
jgi:predicted oxidoreductase